MNLFRLKDGNSTNHKFNERALLFVALVLACFWPLPVAQALLPPPDGGYPFGTTAEGDGALGSLTLSGKGNPTAVHNTALGFDTLFNNTGGNNNTATGASALFHNTDGNFNTATGEDALFSATNGSSNTATGYRALFASSGAENTATGSEALASGGGPGANTADGFQALFSDSIGKSNTATGFQALYNNVFGDGNTAVGSRALFSNSDRGADFNTAIGEGALISNINGSFNTAIGDEALDRNTTGSGNIGLGGSAGFNVTTANNVICIGAVGQNVSNSCYIGNIWNQPGGSQAVYVNSEGKLGAQVSSRRFKDEIKPMEQASDVIYGLKPVSFRYKPEIEPTRPLGFGLIAEEVGKISSDLVMRDKEGKPYSVRYEAVNAMLLNEFLKEHHQVQDLKAIVAAQQKQIEALTAGLQKVSAQVEMSRPAPQTVVDNH